jgi:hypothetical protein
VRRSISGTEHQPAFLTDTGCRCTLPLPVLGSVEASGRDTAAQVSTRCSRTLLKTNPQADPEQAEPFDWLKTGNPEARRSPADSAIRLRACALNAMARKRESAVASAEALVALATTAGNGALPVTLMRSAV